MSQTIKVVSLHAFSKRSHHTQATLNGKYLLTILRYFLILILIPSCNQLPYNVAILTLFDARKSPFYDFNNYTRSPKCWLWVATRKSKTRCICCCSVSIVVNFRFRLQTTESGRQNVYPKRAKRSASSLIFWPTR